MIAGILLCGGAGRRFGADKLLAGEPPIVLAALANLRPAVDDVVAVIPQRRAALHGALAAAGCRVVESERTSRGMGASLAAGVQACAEAEAWIVALGDMPRIDPATVQAIRRALERGAPMAAPYDRCGRRGHPVGFARGLREELLALDGDVGARDLLVRHAVGVERIVTADAGIFVDIDTRADLDALRAAAP